MSRQYPFIVQDVEFIIIITRFEIGTLSLGNRVKFLTKFEIRYPWPKKILFLEGVDILAVT